ncbi:hypothetical protein ACLKA7_009330 [Drosophila subpalustris]
MLQFKADVNHGNKFQFRPPSLLLLFRLALAQPRVLCMLRNIDLDAARGRRLSGGWDTIENHVVGVPNMAKGAFKFSIFHSNTMGQTTSLSSSPLKPNKNVGPVGMTLKRDATSPCE